jgi:hypothetical protein
MMQKRVDDSQSQRQSNGFGEYDAYVLVVQKNQGMKERWRVLS